MVGLQDEARNTVYGHLPPPSPKQGVQPFSPTVTVSSSKVVLGCERHVELVKGWGEEGCRDAGRSLFAGSEGRRARLLFCVWHW